nr:hypothetical protein [Bacteroidales bacterium]
MRTNFLKTADNWINNTLRYPGIEEREFALRKDSWLSALGLVLIISILTLLVYLIDPRQNLLIAYGIFQIALKIILLAAGIWHKRDISVVLFFNQVTIAVVTFVFVLLLGGIPTSGGLILVGLFQVFFKSGAATVRVTVKLQQAFG